MSAEEGSNDKEYLKKVVREAISETRTVLVELRVHEFQILPGRRRLARMNALVEKLSMVDAKLGTKVWELVNAPTVIETTQAAYQGLHFNLEAKRHMLQVKNRYFKDLDWALERCARLEKNPIAKS